MELTDWFDNGEKPVHVGVYERKGFGQPSDTWYNYWDGNYFGYLGSTPEEAVTAWVESGGKKSYHQDYPWRGVKRIDKQVKEDKMQDISFTGESRTQIESILVNTGFEKQNDKRFTTKNESITVDFIEVLGIKVWFFVYNFAESQGLEHVTHQTTDVYKLYHFISNVRNFYG